MGLKLLQGSVYVTTRTFTSLFRSGVSHGTDELFVQLLLQSRSLLQSYKSNTAV
jgi:hypothetical protein